MWPVEKTRPAAFTRKPCGGGSRFSFVSKTMERLWNPSPLMPTACCISTLNFVASETEIMTLHRCLKRGKRPHTAGVCLCVKHQHFSLGLISLIHTVSAEPASFPGANKQWKRENRYLCVCVSVSECVFLFIYEPRRELVRCGSLHLYLPPWIL